MNSLRFSQVETSYMRRALRLATYGMGRVSPNPFVGAVIVADNRIIGEGFHRVYGGPHAEPNAIRSVRPQDRDLMKKATMYVTLEPCSHFGKTPPCAELIVRTGIPEVVIASKDPFLKDYKSGIEVLEDAGIKVRVGLLEKQALFLNRRFMTAHTLKRPFILLKWAQTADGFIGTGTDERLKISTPVTEVSMHRERSLYDAIMVGINTVVCDNPSLTCRLWPNRDSDIRPRKISFESDRLHPALNLKRYEVILKPHSESLADFVSRLYRDFGITSLMVEGGKETLQSFIDLRLFDEMRIEQSPFTTGSGIPAPLWQKAVQEMKMREIETQFSNNGHSVNSIHIFSLYP